ncbi:hypothetical protein [Lysinibacillus sp. 54212]|uniref:hypothetical protein n=1 Tax=Lysinibacillus sp. 54212 TaxID=3119829 RepID=UPI002FCB12FB
MGRLHTFSNYDPTRIRHYELRDGFIYLYMYEEDRLQAMEESFSTLEAFQYEVERKVLPETIAYTSFIFDRELQLLEFSVDKSLYVDDVSVKMIELSLVEDSIRYQVYSGMQIGVTVQYIDYESKEIIETRHYAKNN